MRKGSNRNCPFVDSSRSTTCGAKRALAGIALSCEQPIVSQLASNRLYCASTELQRHRYEIGGVRDRLVVPLASAPLAPVKAHLALLAPVLQSKQRDVVARAEFSLCVEFGKQGEPHPDGHHLADRIKARTLEIVDDASTRSIGEMADILQQTVTPAKSKKFLPGERSQVDCRACGQRMVRGHSEVKSLPADPPERQSGMFWRGTDTAIEAAIGNRSFQGHRVVLVHIKLQAWILLMQSRQKRRQEVGTECRRCAQPDDPAEQGIVRGQLFEQIVQGRKNETRPPRELLACRRWRDVRGPPLEQWCAKTLFNERDLNRQRRLRHAAMARRAPKMPQVVNSDHVFELSEGRAEGHRAIVINYHGDCNNEFELSGERPYFWTVKSQGGTVMDQFIKSLRHRRAILQARIEDEQARPAPDQLRVSALKRLKLRFREQIEFLERMNRHGEKVTIPIVRRRPLRPPLLGKA